MLRKIAIAAVVAAGSAALWPAAATAADKIVISNWDGYMPPDLLANFTRDTGIEAELVLHTTNDEIVGKVQAVGGKGYDVLFISSPYVEALGQQGLLAELDAAQIPNLANLIRKPGPWPTIPATSFPRPMPGHHRPLLSQRRAEDRTDQLDGHAKTRGWPEEADHHASHRALAARGGPEGVGLFHQHH